MADAAPVLVWVMDQRGRCTWFNRPWLQFTGRALADDMGEGWLDGVHPDDAERVRRLCAVHLAQRKPFSIEYRLRRHDGEYRWIQDNGTPLFEGPGSAFSGFVGTCVDITAHIRRREELDASYRRIRELAQHVENVRECERHALAQQLHEGLAQELTGLRLYAGKLQARVQGDAALAAALAELATIAEQAMREIRAITEDLRPSALEHFGLADAIEHYADRFAARSGLQIDCEIAPRLPVIDSLASIVLFRAMQEALTNAAKHAAARQVSISLAAANGHLRLTVRDDGRGIRGKDRTKPGSLGLLGLAERLAPLDGTLEVRGRPGRGTTLVAEIPCPADATAAGSRGRADADDDRRQAAGRS